jgi:class 3 adenylate cyclase
MKNLPTSVQPLNRTFIGSVLFIDIVGYSCRTVPDQLAIKELFNNLLTEAVQNVAPNERIMVDTGDGAGIAFLGDPEDALFAALSLRDAIDAGKATLGEPGFVRMGINLGPLKMVRDINSHTNMIGDGVNDAQRVMSFSEPGHVMVSHSYYDIISRFSRDYTKLFVYEGMRHDKHVREHEVYRFGPTAGAEKLTEQLTEKIRDRSRARNPDDPIPISPSMTPPKKSAPPARGLDKTAASSKRAWLASFPGLMALAIGAMAITGAVWSWTIKPDPNGPEAPVTEASYGLDTGVEPARPINAQVEKAAIITATDAIEKTIQPAAATLPIPVTEKSAEKSEKPITNAAPAAKPGTVKLAIRPWGEIYVDGSKLGDTPPLRSISLAPGKHRIEIRNGEFTPHKQTVEVRSSAETTLHYVF